MERILVIGANGQIGSELVEALATQYGADNVIAADISPNSLYGAKIYEVIDVLNTARLAEVVEKYTVTQVYQLAALLSATGEQAPLKAWTLNMDGLLNILELARIRGEAGKPLKIFWPSSIAAFGPNTPAVNTPQYTVMDPSTIYGISKLAGERLCEYYFQKYGVDVRSIRYPGIISYKSPPGGGTTDYAIAIFHSALRGESYECFLEAETTLPMIYMPDAIRATISLMDAPASKLCIRSSYNVAGLSFNPRELALAIKQNLPDFDIHYAPDSRQAIAATWPQSLDDSAARKDWGWQAEIGMTQLVNDMLKNVKISTGAQAQAA
ncbi:NAD-dependent epimerase/dehydratase family protein [Undibacterium sp. RTI2.1]|uniref:NAD-dependent epimerase/dehydratase family protein n=1 Tax=unclassified Undibacterium TaxID=2630295 RepID=UPI002AB48C2F|nr:MULTISPECIES: NAD-dependent epimerase/dehydratase family protein [unclassified Undibacterium]MDY7537160.1 NAD-dependent epimerase/dehydratase family protein [Undibacterium sp. 5I1]MEB0029801.1 NAD-dependent epimerase/dehydratase family protein [Undibacterium sp. RTI2.1]MEB0115086.1 NAD-dependent epimerase/dehydratase family protein [Undibacterium sp. RTI2.2]MEB0229338.1 NAD-dependent epimerase/dehydratase family protein [Undibacterium sp. 10I3]MEB0256114.1 NAD-dependent epimerase/dehydratas